MNREQAQGAVQVVGAVAALGLFLPSIDKTWDDYNPEMAYRCRTGESVYLISAATITGLASYAYDSLAPFVIGFGIALLIVGFQEHALRHKAQ